MSIVKTLTGSMVGAIIAIGLFFLLRNYVLGSEQLGLLIWFPILTGLLTGAAARFFSGPLAPNGSRILPGTIAALISAVAIFGHEILPPLVDAWSLDHSPIRPEEVTARPRVTGDTGNAADLAQSTETDAAGDAQEESREGDPSDSTSQGDSGEASNDQDFDPAVDAQLRDQLMRRSANPDDPDAGVVLGQDPTNLMPILAEDKDPTLIKQIFPYLMYGIGILLAFQLAVSFRTSKQD